MFYNRAVALSIFSDKKSRFPAEYINDDWIDSRSRSSPPLPMSVPAERQEMPHCRAGTVTDVTMKV